MDNISESAHKIQKLYKNLTYFDQYGGSVFFFIILVFLLFIIYSYFMVMKNIQPIKQNWTQERCKPQNIPFAGFINKPDNMSFIDFTAQNFNYCMNSIQISITGDLLEPVTYLTYSLTFMFKEIMLAMEYLRTIINRIRNSIKNITEDIMGRLSNIIIPLQQIIIGIRDTMEKIKGIITAALYTSLGTYYVLQSLLGAIAEMTIILLIALASLIVVTWIISIFFPPFITAATTLTLLFICVSIPLAVILVFMADVLHININNSIPGVPSRPTPAIGNCFHPETQIKRKDGSIVFMKDLDLGDILENGSRVRAVMKINNPNHEHKLYKIVGKGINNTDIYVTGTHRIQLENGTFIEVKDHPLSIAQSDIKTNWFSCLITDNHLIKIGSHTFWDWEDYLL